MFNLGASYHINYLLQSNPKGDIQRLSLAQNRPEMSAVSLINLNLRDLILHCNIKRKLRIYLEITCFVVRSRREDALAMTFHMGHSRSLS